jgi:lactoylglutathione lyase
MKIDLIVIKTSAPEALANFYSLLGIKFEYHNHGNGPFHFAGKINDTVFEIYPLPKNVESPDNTLRLGFSIKDLDVTIQKLREAKVKIFKDPEVTQWGYQAIVEDLDGRKIELKDEDISIARFQIQDVFKIKGGGIVFDGAMLDGIIHVGDDILFLVNGVPRSRTVKEINSGMIRSLVDARATHVGVMIQCLDANEIDEMKQWKPNGQITFVRNKKDS